MDLLLGVLIAWLSSNFDLPAEHRPPNIGFVAQERLSSIRFGGSVAIDGRALVAVYDDRSRTIYIADDWTGHTPAHTSILIHELVHHLQNDSKRVFACPAEREALAYEAQERWLGLFNQSLAAEFGIDAFTLKVRTSCM